MHRGTADYSDWRSMRELDAEAAAIKGTAFRAFKQLLPQLVEGRDFIILDHQIHASLAAALHASGKMYRSTVTPVLLAPSAADQVRDAMKQLETRP